MIQRVLNAGPLAGRNLISKLAFLKITCFTPYLRPGWSDPPLPRAKIFLRVWLTIADSMVQLIIWSFGAQK